MNNSFEQTYTEFNNRARSAFFALYKDFLLAISVLDRQEDENVFQLVKSKYQSKLKQQLKLVAEEMMSKNNSSQNNEQLKEALPYEIEGYISEFTQKINSL